MYYVKQTNNKLISYQHFSNAPHRSTPKFEPKCQAESCLECDTLYEPKEGSGFRYWIEIFGKPGSGQPS